MEDLLKYGLVNGIFEPKSVMNLIYGNMGYFSEKNVISQKMETFSKWDAYPHSEKYWLDIPLERRMEIIALVIEQCPKGYYSDLSCFHDRMLCLMHELLNDEENRVKCIYHLYDGMGTDITDYRRYDAFVDQRTRRALVTEIFLWWHMGIRKSDEERRILKKCWIKFLGFERKNSLKSTIALVEQKIEKLETELKAIKKIVDANDVLIRKRYVREKKEIKKLYRAGQKREFLLSLLKEKTDAAYYRFWKGRAKQEEFQLTLDFLGGFLDYVSALSQLKAKS
ncbi:MAG: hypothetical protein IKN71_08305 [Alphaproteobacteria bacterium]|nr:hypothetical protein [Alphaproteobacteria bacterium]